MHHFDHPERRKTPRHPIFVEGTICFAGRFHLRCLVQNFSEGGAKLAFNTATHASAEFTLNILLEGKETQYLVSTIWRKDRSTGVEFIPLPRMNAFSLQSKSANLAA